MTNQKPIIFSEKDQEIKLLKTIISDLKCCIQVADWVIEAGERTARAQEEELVVLRMERGN